MPSVKILEDIPEDKGLLAHAARLLRATFAQDWERVDPWLAHDFSDQKPLQGQVDGPAGYKQVASTLLAELGSKYSFSVAWISQGRVLADIDFGTADQPKRRIVWELIFRNRVLIERTMMSAGCTLFRELYDERHPRSSWNRFCDEVSDLAKGIATLRAAIIVCALFGILMLLPAQTWELIREAPFNEEDPFTFENLLIGSTLLSAAIALFGWLELIECGEREVTALPGDVRPVKTLVFKTRRLGLLAILAGTIPLLTGLALLKARLPLPDAAGEDAATFSSWDWVSIGLMTTPRVPKVTPLHIHWALTIWGYISLVCGALVIAGGAAFICAPRRWLGTLVVESYRKYFWIAVVVTGFAAFALVFPTTGLNSAPVIFTSWCVLMLATLSVITQIASRTRFPLLLFLICLFIGLSLSDVNDNHAVRLASKDSTAGQTPDITQAFKDWLAARPDPKSKERYPVFVVAAEGGGIRAAVMTAMVLDELRHNEKFISHLFAIVGVSGGSVGASTFAAAVRQNLPALHPKEAVALAQPGQTNWQSALHADLLSPTLRTLLGLDLLTHFWPRGFSDMSVWDRTRTLEETLASRWKIATGQELLNVSFDGMRPRTHMQDPALVLMTTSVATGQPVAISHLGQPGFSTLEVAASDVRVPLITAAFMSARFPIITPAALVLTKGKTQRYVDGGYFENSGVTAATDLIQAIKDKEILKSVRFIVLRIVNGSTQELAHSQKSSYFSEISAPVLALYRTNDARERSALKALRGLEEQHPAGRGCEQVGTSPKIEEITFQLVQRKEVPLPLGWYLSAGARREIAAQLGEEENRKCFEAVTRTLIQAQ